MHRRGTAGKLLLLLVLRRFRSSLLRLISVMVTVVVCLSFCDLFSGELGCAAKMQNIVFY